MHPELWRIPIGENGWPLPAFGLMVALGTLLGAFFLGREARRRGWDSARAIDIAIWSVMIGLAGARIFYYVQFYDRDFKDESFLAVFAVWNGGLVLYGGVIAGVLSLFLLLRRSTFSITDYLDALAPSLAVGISLGRIGCFLNGCCWGKECAPNAWFAVRFPETSAAGADMAHHLQRIDVPVHPTQIYESVACLVLAVVLMLVQRKTSIPGLVASGFFILYGGLRYWIETLRGDHHVTSGGWTVSQIISLGAIGFGALLAIRCVARYQKTSAEPPNVYSAS
ncbi:MAG: prolipoprotein diacylglyceryl transferase [Planctomycetota bacterium]